ncbi:MAG: CoA transferase, partial [Candidatus Tectomicrobia bacterium]|nr:CoA transferase [Candidatus Tectomicrobia bacterium]
TQILADFGAEVIKVEHKDRRDQSRLHEPLVGERRGINSSSYFNNFNRSKLSISLNARHPKGIEILRKLIAISDVVIENYSAGVMERWKLGYDDVIKINPEIIYISMAGLGHSGPYKHYQTFGPTIQALSGLTFLSGLPGRPPAGWGFSYMDHMGGYFAAAAILIALYHKNQTGKGQYIDLAQAEAGVALTGTTILDATVNSRPARRPGNPDSNRPKHPPAAPHGVYRCAGEDRWCALAVLNDDQWQALCMVMGDPDWCRDPKYESPLNRVKYQDEIDPQIEEWTKTLDTHDLMRRLQVVGIPAGVVQSGEDLNRRDPQLEARGFFEELDHPEIGRARFEGVPMKLSKTPGRLLHAAPLLGEHNDYVYGKLLGMSREEIRQYTEEGVF